MSEGTEDLPADGIPMVPAHAPPHVDRRLLSLLVCPVTRGPLIYDAERQELISKGAGRAFPIHDGIPVMLVDEARPLED
jgi:uncharacterized protein YbaR (Trm112 family)